MSNIRTGVNTHTNFFQGKSTYEFTIYLSRATGSLFILAGKGRQFNLKDVIIAIQDECIQEISGVNVNKLDTYSVGLDTFEISKFEIRALELLGRLYQLTALQKIETIVEELDLVKNKGPADSTTQDQEDYLLLYSLDETEGVTVPYLERSDCKAIVSYICEPDTKELKVNCQ